MVSKRPMTLHMYHGPRRGQSEGVCRKCQVALSCSHNKVATLRPGASMANRIGIRELKNRASEIVHEVKENEAEYIVTFRGEPVAVLRPFPGTREGDLRQAQ